MKDNITFFGISLNPSVFLIELFVHAIVLMSILAFLAGLTDNQLVLGVTGFAFIVSILLKGRELGNKYLKEDDSNDFE